MSDGPTEDTRQLVYQRSGGFCEFCRMVQVGPRSALHHRRTRGGSLPWLHEPDNLVIVCDACHVPIIHAMPALARRYGFIIRRGIADQLGGEVWRIPITDQRQYLWVISRDGQKRPWKLDDWHPLIEANN